MLKQEPKSRIISKMKTKVEKITNERGFKMTKYLHTLLEQELIDGKRITTDTCWQGINATEENITIATSRETMKFFRNMGSKQKVTRTKNNKGLKVVKIYSYAPYDNCKRNVHIYNQVEE